MAVPPGRRSADTLALARRSQVHRCAGMFYWVHSGRTRRGVATAAIQAMARLAFDELGAQREGLLRRRFLLADGSHDAFMFSLIAADLAP
jgi:RimJ/RimL family protein N-acetyltransferase